MNAPKTAFLPLFLFATIGTPTATIANAIKLESSFVRMLDGWPIDGPTLFDAAFLVKKMREMVYGKIVNQATKEHEGLYTVAGKKYGTAVMAEMEKTETDPKIKHELNVALQAVKNDFINLTKPFLAQVECNKMPVLKLISESCTKRNVPDSFLLSWADTREGEEAESFNRRMTSHEDFTRFVNDLCNFISDLFNSCPKAHKQYDELIKRYHKK